MISFTKTQLTEISALVEGTEWFMARNKEIDLGPIPVWFNSVFVGNVEVVKKQHLDNTVVDVRFIAVA